MKTHSDQIPTTPLGFLAGVCKREKTIAHEIGGIDDHVHMLMQLPAALSLSDAVQELKTSSPLCLGR